jgi:hypothetical protein
MQGVHISLDDTQTFGPSATHRVRLHLAADVAVPTVLQGALLFFCDEVDHATTTLGALIAATRTLASELHGHTEEKKPALRTAKSLLGKFSRHLDTQDGPVDRRSFFTHDGTAGGVGESASRVLLAVTHIEALLGGAGATISEAPAWKKKFHAAAHALAPAIADSDNTKTTRQHTTPEQEAARHAWLNEYTALKGQTETVLRHIGALGELHSYFDDLNGGHARGHAASGGDAPTPASPPPASGAK